MMAGSRLPALKGHHECDILEGIGQELEESTKNWRLCQKNPGHENFMSVSNFLEDFLPRLPTIKRRKSLSSLINLTVKVSVYWTSEDREDQDPLSPYRGCSMVRLGSGFVDGVPRPVYNNFCPCPSCDGNVMRTFWEFHVVTAHHVVFNTEEAKKTRVDLFYDDVDCEQDGRMKTVWGVEVQSSVPDKDYCRVLCVTHDRDLGERLESLCFNSQDKGGQPIDIGNLNMLSFHDRDRDPTVVVSHPHGQPKKITVGEMKYRDKEGPLVKYNTRTCAGCSGGPVFVLDLNNFSYFWLLMSSVHSGTLSEHCIGSENQVNFGYQR